ncbi:hypothetical protein HanIR_Chr15g0743681 [Helianthus annuus]|nr:hypothetical protein HanIR_Chr15g0743681 [Helianthus annuus]
MTFGCQQSIFFQFCPSHATKSFYIHVTNHSVKLHAEHYLVSKKRCFVVVVFFGVLH